MDWAVDTTDLWVKDVVVCVSIAQSWTCRDDHLCHIGIYRLLQCFRAFSACASPLGWKFSWLQTLERLSCRVIAMKFYLLHATRILWVWCRTPSTKSSGRHCSVRTVHPVIAYLARVAHKKVYFIYSIHVGHLWIFYRPDAFLSPNH